MNNLKVFELRWTEKGEKEWMCARTNIEALKCYLNITDTNIIELDDLDEIVEIPKEKWSEYKVVNPDHDGDDWKEMTFEDWMEGRTDPDIIAGTMYE